MMKRVRLPLLVAAAFWAIASCASEPTGPVDFAVDPLTHTLIVGQSVQLSALDAPGAVSWSSSNSGIAEVVPTTGLVTGRAPGSATITAVSGPSYSSATVTVNPDPAQQNPFSGIAPIFTTLYPGARNNLPCSSCHADVSGALAYDWVRARVTPGDPNAGVLICKITSAATCPGNPMPLPAAQIQAIRTWITAGAHR